MRAVPPDRSDGEVAVVAQVAVGRPHPCHAVGVGVHDGPEPPVLQADQQVGQVTRRVRRRNRVVDPGRQRHDCDGGELPQPERQILLERPLV